MKCFRMGLVCFAMIVASLAVQSAFGHGFSLSLNGNKLDGDGRETGSSVPASLKHLFVSEDPLVPVSSLFTSTHGSVTAKVSSAGAYLPGFDAADTFRIDFIGPLWYSTGNSVNGIADPAPVGSLQATSLNLDMGIDPTVTIDGTSTNPGGFAVTGQSNHSIGWILSGISLPDYEGAYGVAYKVSGLNDGNMATPFGQSDPLVVVFHTPGFTGDLEAAAMEIYTAAVPEPGTVALSLAGFGSLILAGWWRKRRQS